MKKTYKLARDFKRKHPMTVAWRIRSHCRVVDKHLNPGEEVLYVFFGQKNRSSFDFVNTNIVVLTSKRLIFATKRLVFGYFFTAITPEMFNDITVKASLIWGKVIIDTVKEKVCLSNISRSALPEIETQITDYMMKEKKKYRDNESKNKENSGE